MGMASLACAASDMSARMSRTLADGLARGMNPRDIARELNEAVDLGERRSYLVSHDAIIRAHAEGQLDAFEDLGVEDIGVAVEWTVTKTRDGQIEQRVCQACRALDGVVLKIQEARGMLPRHNL